MTIKKTVGTRAKPKATKSDKSDSSNVTPIAKKSEEMTRKGVVLSEVRKADKAPKSQTSESQPIVLRKKELFERVVAMSGAKKCDVKVVVEATLKVLGDALAAGESLALPPFGRAKVNRQKDLDSGEMMVVKLRRNTADDNTDPQNAPLAEATQ